MGLALEIVEIVKASIPAGMDAARVTRVNLRVGQLSAVVPDSLRFCFGAVTQSTPLEGAELAITHVPVVARCLQCGHQWTIDTPAFVCRQCQSPSIEVLSGRELDIDSIEVANGDEPDVDPRQSE
jgi:hydrogenase nickel incorporation protein HypA/HybF